MTPLSALAQGTANSGAPAYSNPDFGAATSAPVTVPGSSVSKPLPALAPPLIALVLPAQTTPFGRVAEVVRQGFMAADALSGQAKVELIEIDEGTDQVAAALAKARQSGARVIVGPLTRPQVMAAIAAKSGVPLVTLSLPEGDVSDPSVLAFGLSIEQEARFLTQTVLARRGPPVSDKPRFGVLIGQSSLARRAGAAFRDALKDAGERTRVWQLAVGYESIHKVSEEVNGADLAGVFLALDAREAANVRPRLLHDLPMYATSQVNLGGAEAALLAPELEGVMFIDAPWLVEPDHLAVAVYPKPEQALSGELQRLYALGIDAYRLALEWMGDRTRFKLDGVTGQLEVDRGRSTRVERAPSFAVFRNGAVEAVELRR